MVEVYILTGPAGAGKSTAQFVFEESGFYVNDNIVPDAVIPTLNFLLKFNHGEGKYLFVVAPGLARDVYSKVTEYKADKKDFVIKNITLKCDEKVLLQRFKLTRHVHPVAALKNIALTDAIRIDNDIIDSLYKIADYRIDTTDLTALDLRKLLFSIINNKNSNIVTLCFMSFGHKHSIPMDVDLVLDTRALPNPYWISELRKYSGKDQPIIDYLESLPITDETFKHMVDYLDFYLEQVQKDGRGNYTIGVCCSGGRHRSVYFAERLANYYKDKYSVSVIHRDIDKQ